MQRASSGAAPHRIDLVFATLSNATLSPRNGAMTDQRDQPAATLTDPILFN